MVDDSLERMQAAANANVTLDDPLLPWNDNEDADSLDDLLKRDSENAYRVIAQQIVKISTEQLEKQNDSKNRLKKIFTRFFIIFISIQYFVLVALLFIKAFCDVDLNEIVLTTYISSVFIETLGAILIMIKYAFDSEQEVNILEILNSVISNYQKFGGEKNEKGKNEEEKSEGKKRK